MQRVSMRLSTRASSRRGLTQRRTSFSLGNRSDDGLSGTFFVSTWNSSSQVFLVLSETGPVDC
jgi:hypothetical protein